MDRIKNQIQERYLRGEISPYALQEISKLCQEAYSAPLSPTDELPIVENGCLEEADRSEVKVSVIIPTYNRANMLCRCVDSVLTQSHRNLEIIIIDDGSSDNTPLLIREKYENENRITYLRNQKNLGPGGNRQKAYNISTGAFIVFADDDDFYFEPDFFKKAVNLFFEFPKLSMVCANSIIYNNESKRIQFEPVSFSGEMKGEQFFLGFSSKYRKPNSTFPTMFRKSALDKADFANMWMMNDTSIYLRAACVGDVYMIKDWVGAYLVHSSNISKSLPHRFILDNLDEKKNIFSLAKNNMSVPLDDWLYTQLMVTIRYYLHSKRLALGKVVSLLNWTLRNGESIKVRLFKDTFMYWRKNR